MDYASLVNFRVPHVSIDRAQNACAALRCDEHEMNDASNSMNKGSTNFDRDRRKVRRA